MNKTVGTEELNEWAFPDLDSSGKFLRPAEIEKEKKRKEQELRIQKLKQEADALIKEYEAKMLLVAELFKQLENPLSVVDDEVLGMFQDIIKKAVKRIIHKEIEADPKIINDIVKELSDIIVTKNGVINVLLSEADYKRLDLSASAATHVVKASPELAEGDVIVKSHAKEIRAVLNDRIEQIFGMKT